MHVRIFVSALAALTLPVLAACQTSGELQLPSFSELAPQATQSVDLTLGPSALSLASAFMDADDPQSAALKQTLLQLQSVQIRSYVFRSDFAYPRQDIDRVRRQLTQPLWRALVQVHDRESHEDVDIYIARDGRTARGLAIIASTARELTVLNIVGSVPLDQVGALRRMLTPSVTGEIPLEGPRSAAAQ